MPLRPRFAAVLLVVLAAAIPQMLWVGTHLGVPHEHGHAGEVDGQARACAAAEAVVHGHAHDDGAPDHEHQLLASPVFRPHPPQSPPSPVALAFRASPPEAPLSAVTRGGETVAPAGHSPPRLHLLCTLLI